MGNPPAASPGLRDCPLCGERIMPSDLGRHYREKHPGRNDDVKVTVQSNAVPTSVEAGS
jgi:hypothetical protein